MRSTIKRGPRTPGLINAKRREFFDKWLATLPGWSLDAIPALPLMQTVQEMMFRGLGLDPSRHPPGDEPVRDWRL